MKQTKVICPKCGAEVAIADHQHTVANATVIGKDSNLGTIALPLAEESRKPMKADERLAALKAAGVDTTNLFAMQSASGEGMLVRVKDGVPSTIADDDPIFAAITKAGFTYNPKLARRWVMAQMFEMLTCTPWRTKEPMGFTEALKRKGYNYSWTMLLEELHTLVKLAQRDKENFDERKLFFTPVVVEKMFYDYERKLKDYFKSLKVRHCKGVPYIRLSGRRDFFLSDLDKKFYAPVRRHARLVHNATTLGAVETIVRDFLRSPVYVALPWGTPQCREWMDAYKGAGAFYTMQNLIRFHGCTFKSGNRRMSLERSYAHLVALATQYAGEGWRLLGVLKEFLEDNNVDLKAKKEEWRQAKLAKARGRR